ncbi:hypothetical protein PMAYCL1PPCAC_04157, partial [Pristionchus mayeri]
MHVNSGESEREEGAVARAGNSSIKHHQQAAMSSIQQQHQQHAFSSSGIRSQQQACFSFLQHATLSVGAVRKEAVSDLFVFNSPHNLWTKRDPPKDPLDPLGLSTLSLPE